MKTFWRSGNRPRRSLVAKIGLVAKITTDHRRLLQKVFTNRGRWCCPEGRLTVHEEVRLCACLHLERRLHLHLGRLHKEAPRVVSRIPPCRSSYWSKSDEVCKLLAEKKRQKEESPCSQAVTLPMVRIAGTEGHDDIMIIHVSPETVNDLDHDTIFISYRV